MPRKGYKPTGYKIKMPDSATKLDKHLKGWTLYAELANCPLYVKVRIIAPRLLGTGRSSFHLGWKINEKQWAKISDYFNMPSEVLAWAEPFIIEAYPSVHEATGLSMDEVLDLIDEQRAKRQAHIDREAREG